MPRTTEEILRQADELARRFEEHEPDPEQIRDARSLRDVAAAFESRAQAERTLTAAVHVARSEGHSWSAIGAMLGTTGEAARQRYSHRHATRPRQVNTAGRSRAAEIREWAAREGRTVRGDRIPAHVIRDYEAAAAGQRWSCADESRSS